MATASEPLLRTLVRLPLLRWFFNTLGRFAISGRGAVVLVPYAWLLLFFAIPFVIVLKISLADQVIAQPPYTALVQWTEDTYLQIKLNLGNYLFLVQDALYWKAYLNSVKIAFISAFVCLLIGYPMAYAMARAEESWRNVLLMLVVLPFWTSFLLRVYAWIGILNNTGLINNWLIAAGIIDEPITMIRTNFAVYIGIVYSYLPFMILPLYSTLEKLDNTLLEAAADLGCRPFEAFLTITLPLSMPGVVAGFSLVFIPALGEFVIPDLLGGKDSLMIGHVLWDEFFANRAWPVASAVAIAMLTLVLLLMAGQRKLEEKAETAA
ncbi:MAG: ABC transporter permease subunit [Gammaproteobacteria bacterium]|nr:ABC transporter permease subunit [Gammaproteobacteria bacterium]MBI5617944.1 ABC transporter permease subunit [Gammaproteobacteria bacterium]